MSCHYDEMTAVDATLKGIGETTPEPCGQPSEFIVRVSLLKDTHDVEATEVTTRGYVCAEHDTQLRAAPGYTGSWKVPRHAPV